MISETLARHVVGASTEPLPPEVHEKTTHHLLDTLAAIISGGDMEPGRAGADLARTHPGGSGSTVLATGDGADATRAALANGMAAHADETDDSHEPSLTHPGCAIVPAALAVAERHDRSGDALVKAVALGYDVGTRITRALWSDNDTLRTQGHSTHAIGGLFGAAAAAGSLMGLTQLEVQHMFAYATQEASGSRTWRRDVDHIEKAYAFAGMPAMTGVWVAIVASAGWSGVRDVFDGGPSIFDTFGIDPDPHALVGGLGDRYEILATNIKRFSVGSPIQAPLDGLLQIISEEGLAPHDVVTATVRMPASLVRVVDDPEMPNINLQYLTTVAVEDGDVSFVAAHDRARFDRWKRDPDRRLEVIKDPSMAAVRQAIVTVTTTDDRAFTRHVTAVRGTSANPMTREEVEHKAYDLVAPRLGDGGAAALIAACRTIGGAERCSDLVAASTPA